MSSFHAVSRAEKEERPAVHFRHDSNYFDVHGTPNVSFGSFDLPNQTPRRRRDSSQPVLYSGGKPQHVDAHVAFGTAVPDQSAEYPLRQQHNRAPQGIAGSVPSSSMPANPPESIALDVMNPAGPPLSNARPPRPTQDHPLRPQNPPLIPSHDAVPVPQSHPAMSHSIPPAPQAGLPVQQMPTQGMHFPPGPSVSPFPTSVQPYGRPHMPAARPAPGQHQGLIHQQYPFPFSQHHHHQQYQRNGPRTTMGMQQPLQSGQVYSTSPGGTPQYMSQIGPYMTPVAMPSQPVPFPYPVQSHFAPPIQYAAAPASRPTTDFVVPPKKSVRISRPGTGEAVDLKNINLSQSQQASPAEIPSPQSPLTPPALNDRRQSKAVAIKKPLKDANPKFPKPTAGETAETTPASPADAAVPPTPEMETADEKKIEPASPIPEVREDDDKKRQVSPSRRGPPSHPEPLHSSQEPATSRREPSPSHREPSPSRQEPSPSRQEPTPSHREPSPSRREPSPSRREPAPSRQEPPSHREPSPSRREPSPSRQEPLPSRPEPSPSRQKPAQSRQEPSESRQEPSESRQELPPARRESSPSHRGRSPSRPESSPSYREPSPSRRELSPLRPEPSLSQRAPSPSQPIATTAKPDVPATRIKSPDRAATLAPEQVIPTEVMSTMPGSVSKAKRSTTPLEEPGKRETINVDGAHARTPCVDKDEGDDAEALKRRNTTKTALANAKVVDDVKPETPNEVLEDGEIREDPRTNRQEFLAKDGRPTVGRKGAPANIDVARARAGELKKPESSDGVSRSESSKSTTPITEGRCRYDRDFLILFMSICKEKPEGLKPMDAIAGEDSGPPRMPLNVRGKPPASIPRAASGSSRIPGTFTTGQMGNFQVPVSKTSEQRFMESSKVLSSRGLTRASSSSNLLPPASMPGPTFSRPDDRRRGGLTTRMRDDRRTSSTARIPQSPAPTGLTIPAHQIAPLERSQNRWVPKFVDVNPNADNITLNLLEKKVKGLLNKLTVEKFGRLAPQIVEFANRSEHENDGRSLTTVIRLTFEKATDEPAFSAMYAQLCQTMQERLSPHIIDLNVQKDGRPITGGNLFRKHLLNRCQEDFEKGWKAEEGEGKPKEAVAPGTEILTDEYYAAQKKKRRGLGLIRFIGELFKLQMLTERIMQTCVIQLLETPEEEETESLCKLLTTVGRQLDHEKARDTMNKVFQTMEGLAKNEELPSRIRYMVQDVIEVRKNNWVPRVDASGPKTIAQIHQDAERQKQQQAVATAEALRRAQSSGGRGMPGIGKQARRDSKDGWQLAGGQQKRVDTSNFGKFTQISSSNSRLGPGGVFAAGGSKGWKADKKEESSPLSRTSSSNAFSLLQAEGDHTAKAAEPERPKIKVLAKGTSLPPATPPGPPAAEKASEEEQKVIESMMKEFWAVHDVKVVVEIVRDDIRNPDAHVSIVRGFVEAALEKKESDVKAAASVLSALVDDAVVTREQVRDAFVQSVPVLEDTVLDAPKAPQYFKRLIEAARLPADDISVVLDTFTDEVVKAAVA